jgi:hypothetical protein
MNGRRESDRSVVPKEKKRPSNDTTAGAMGKETAKGRDLAAGNMDQPNAPRTQSRSSSANSGRERVREVARKDRGVKLTALRARDGDTRRKVNRVHDADTRGFDAIERERLKQHVGHRIGDRRVRSESSAHGLPTASCVSTSGKSRVR